MGEKLTVEEQAILEWIAREGKPVHVRRARLLLLWDQGLAPKDISLQVGLSARQVYYWLRAFRERRMDVFPAELSGATVPLLAVATPVEPLLAEEASAEPAIETSPSEPLPVEEVPAEPGIETPPSEPLPVEETLAESAIEAPPSEPWGTEMPGPESVEVTVEAERPEITVEELCQRYDVDVAHARHVADLALALFDLTADVHGLPPERRDLLEKAAILHNVGFSSDPQKHHAFGRDIILEHQLVGLGEVEQQMVACTTAFHRKKFKPKRLKKEPSFTVLPAEVQDDALVMAALIRLADGLDYSQSQTSALGEAQRSPQAIVVHVTGFHAGEDAGRAQKKADMWHHLFNVRLRFVVEGEPGIWIQPYYEVAEAVLPKKKLKAPGILPKDPMSEAGRKVLLFHFERMLEHEPGTRLGEDIEELHDMRVATRRMRSAFRVFSPYFDPDALRPFLKGLKRTGGALGSVRDLDVFMEKAQRYLDGLPEEERSGLDPLLANWLGEREAARAQMLNYLDGKKYQRFVRDFGQFLLTEGAGALSVPADKPLPHRVCHVVPTLIYNRYKIVRGYETVIEDAPIETLHALRIDCKRLRYSLEFFQEVLGSEAKDVIKEAVIIQDHLGDLHDADVACGLLVGFLDGWAKAEQRERINVSGVAGYLVAKQKELRELIESFPEAWRHFNRPEVRRKLALAVSVL